jgi:hypothetical protein
VRIAEALARCDGWSKPHSEGDPFRLACRLGDGASEARIAAAWGTAVPQPVRELWRASAGARLFVDVDYGQWGLQILSPEASAERSRSAFLDRPSDVRPDDIVLGEFLGDQDLLLVDTDERPLIALPLDVRDDWFRPATTLADFLERYVASGGEKYWSGRA